MAGGGGGVGGGGVAQVLAVRWVGQQLPHEGADKFQCRLGSTRGGIVLQKKDIFLASMGRNYNIFSLIFFFFFFFFKSTAE